MSLPTEAPTPEELLSLATKRPLYKPGHVAADLGVSHDCVIAALNKRPSLFPASEPGFKRRREWTSIADFVAVMHALCSISPYAAKCAHARLTRLELTDKKTSGKIAENAMEALIGF